MTLVVLLAASACSGGGGGTTDGGGGVQGGSGSSGATGAAAGVGAAGASNAAGTTGSAASGTAGTSTPTAGVGAAGTGGGGTAPGASGAGGVGAAGVSGAAGTSAAGTNGAAGSTACAVRVLSLAANGTGTASDAAYARVVVDLMANLPIGNANRTVEFWAFIKPTDWVGEKNELFEYGAAGSATAIGLDFGTNPVSGMPANHATLNPITNGGFNDDSTNDLGITSATSQWVHIAMTWDGTALRTYVNAAVAITTMGSGGITKLATVASPLMIGCNFQNMNCFNGELAEFRLWNVARSATQLKDSYKRRLTGNETGLVGYWRFDDAPGATMAADSVTGAQTPHAGSLMAAAGAQRPTFVAPAMPVPLTCN